ncbi:MAG: divergent polysaccharide deacetylase family protein [Candidatus Eisenbacteria bacterium]|nr:divergent polysaccharide deacetylase family protein [Candidatus Eisenbacteria bacterium]
MAKKRAASRENRTPFIVGVVVVAALLLFLAGELFAWATSDYGRIVVYRWLHVGDRPQAVRLVGKSIQKGLERAGVPATALEQKVVEGPDPQVRWIVTLERDGAPLLVNHAITRAVEAGGAQVLSGRESPGKDGELAVTLMIGVPGRPTHRLDIVRPARPDEDAPRETGKLALLLFAAAEDESLLVAAAARSEVFAIAAPATGAGKSPVLRIAHEKKREVVLFMPLEPENYPRVNPGPATLLVNMSSGQIEQRLRREIDLAAPTIAVANLMGSFATQDEAFMKAFYEELKRAHLPFLHVNGVPRSVCRALASRVGAAYDEPDVMLDAETRRGDAKALDKAWSAAVTRAHERGSAIVMLRINKRSAPWLERALTAKRLEGVELAPLSTVIRRPMAQH